MAEPQLRYRVVVPPRHPVILINEDSGPSTVLVRRLLPPLADSSLQDLAEERTPNDMEEPGNQEIPIIHDLLKYQ